MRYYLFCIQVVIYAITFIGVIHAQQRIILFEQFTGAWCGYCPNGALIGDELSNNHTRVISVKIHHNDIMEVPGLVTTDFYSFAYGQGGFPAASFNRTAVGGTGFVNLVARDVDWKNRLTDQLTLPALADINITGFTYNSASRSFSLNTNAKLLQTMEGELRWNLYLIEDSVSGSAAYNQRSYFNATSGHPLFGKGDPLVNYVHRHVLRRAWGGAWGVAGSIAGALESGKTISTTFSGTIPPEYLIERCRLVVFIQRFHNNVAQREVLQAHQVSFTQAVPTSVQTYPQNHLSLHIYPQPATLGVTVEYQRSNDEPVALSIVSLLGLTVWSSEIPASGKRGRVTIPTHHLAPGSYYLVSRTNTGLQSMPLVVSR